jgi:DNA-binding PadR family transcriptional regulator
MPKPETLLPLKPLVFDVLLILNEGESHGYGIAKELQERSPKGRRILPGNLYRTLSGMIGKNLIEKSPRDRARRGAAEEDERRRYFRITVFGRQVAKAEAERLQDRVALARAQSLLTGSQAR